MRSRILFLLDDALAEIEARFCSREINREQAALMAHEAFNDCILCGIDQAKERHRNKGYGS